MPRGGARPGSGAPKGPRQSTVDKAVAAEMAVVEAKLNGKPLAKDVLQDFMQLFVGMAAVYQPTPPGQDAVPGRYPNDAKFEKYAALAVDVAKALLPTQTPSLRAIQVFSPPGVPGDTKPGDGAKLIDVKDAKAIQQEYLRMIKGPAPK